MAKRKKSKGGDAAMAAPSSGGSERLSTNIEGAENGYVVNVSGESGGKDSRYFSKKFVAMDRPSALRIASSCLAGGSSKSGKKKSSGRKKISLKQS
jgi:hypothetical protein